MCAHVLRDRVMLLASGLRTGQDTMNRSQCFFLKPIAIRSGAPPAGNEVFRQLSRYGDQFAPCRFRGGGPIGGNEDRSCKPARALCVQDRRSLEVPGSPIREY